jgi:hypothetical protein
MARHSKQIPMPHKGPRGSPETDMRQASPAVSSAALTIAPRGTVVLTPLTQTVSVSSMGRLLLLNAAGEIGDWIDGELALQ